MIHFDDFDDPDGDKAIYELSKLCEIAYQRQRKQAALRLGTTVATLDKIVKQARAETAADADELPHWNVEPWPEAVDTAQLLDDIEAVFTRYIVLPKGAADAIALWVLHAWTVGAGEISPFLVLSSPTKRCGKTTVLIVLYYVTPRSELASNITPSALFRYIEKAHPTLLVDEGDSFVKENEELRGILNSGHTKAAAHVIRNVESNGQHEPRRFSTWAPKAIATIGGLADTLEDRAVVVPLQRKPKSAKVTRLRRRDSDDFVNLRSRAARWAADNWGKLTDPDPDMPEVLNDRAADNWRPLLAIADLAGAAWSQQARNAACVLSGEEQGASDIKAGLLLDIRAAFGDADAIRSLDLVAKLIADPERPWAEWKHSRPLTQRQLGGLLRPFGIMSETVSIAGLNDAKGYRRVRFEEAWEAYLPGQNAPPSPIDHSEASKRRNADGIGITRDFQSVAASSGDGSKNANLSHCHAGSDASTDRKRENDGTGNLTNNPATASKPTPDDNDLDIPDFLWRGPPRTPVSTHSGHLRVVPPDRQPTLGPPGDSLDDSTDREALLN